jgi:hypothetical protein
MSKQSDKSRSVFSGRFHMAEQDRAEVMMKPVPSGSSSAADALHRMGNAVPRIEKIKLGGYTVPSDGGGEPIDVDPQAYALCRLPGWQNDKRVMHLDLVGENYQVITPAMMAEAWDSIIGRTPTGIQFQRSGTAMLLETKIDEFDVMSNKEANRKGDIVQRNFFMMNPTDGGGSVVGGIREIRLICTNGLIREAVNVESFKVKHDNRAFEFMCEWMSHIWAQVTNEPLTETAAQYRALTQQRATIETVRWIINELYPLPEAPDAGEWERPRKTSFSDAMKRHEWLFKKAQEQHMAIEGLFNGGGTGIEGETAWDVLNTFTEWSNYRKGTSDTIVAETINGARANEMQKAWKMVQQHLADPVL